MLPLSYGIDFGTTNSVVTALTPDGAVRTARFGPAELEAFRTVLCFSQEREAGRAILRHTAGPDAIAAYLDDPLDARLMMSLKTYLAQKSFTQTQVYHRAFALEDLVSLFLRALCGGAALPPGARITAGRPVRFAGERADDALGEARLRESFRRAGIGEIEIALEPLAAGYRFTSGLSAPATVMIGDFGGGTSDFSLLRFEPGSAHPVTALANTGVGIAGDALDYRIIDRVISPLLGKGSSYSPGGTALPVPPEYYSGFARWHRLSLMRSPRILRDIEAVARHAEHPAQLHHLIRLIEDEAGFQLYQAVSAAKAALSRTAQTRLTFHHGDFAVDQVIERPDFEAWIAPDLAAMADAIDRALAQAALAPGAVDRVFLTGGTSFVPAIQALFTARFGAERVSAGGEFVSVAEGLALIGRDRALAG
jgi:hypothetical chaperone protein